MRCVPGQLPWMSRSTVHTPVVIVEAWTDGERSVSGRCECDGVRGRTARWSVRACSVWTWCGLPAECGRPTGGNRSLRGVTRPCRPRRRRATVALSTARLSIAPGAGEGTTSAGRGGGRSAGRGGGEVWHTDRGGGRN